MIALGPIAFANPWLLLGLLALPILWLILRAVPPAPITRRFPGVALLLGLTDDETQSDRTPWWLLLLRLLAVAALIIGLSGPVMNPTQQQSGTGNLVIAVDATWAGAPVWQSHIERIDGLLAEASRQGRPTAIVPLTRLPVGPLQFVSADTLRSTLANLQPAAWQPSADTATWFADTPSFETYWIADGLDYAGRSDLITTFEALGTLRVFQSPRQIFALHPARYQDGDIILDASRSQAGTAADIDVTAIGRDPAGIERRLETTRFTFAAGDDQARVSMTLPPELRNRVTRFELTGNRSAGAVTLADDSLRRRKVALLAGRTNREGLDLLSPLHYLREALSPSADLIEAEIDDILLASPDAIILADVASFSPSTGASLQTWVENGGLLVRFAGPSLAATDQGRDGEHPLLPVRLRTGGRSIGGAMSWGAPKRLAPFTDTSPFFGLPVPPDVSVSTQVMAQPDPTLASRVIAQLEDGTPLVTRKTLGQGQVVLFHVTANAGWSNLPLSGLFVQMLDRLAVSTRPIAPEATALAGTTWVSEKSLDGFGGLQESGDISGVAGDLLLSAIIGPDLPPGLYRNDQQQIALNVMDDDATLTAAAWPSRIPVEGLRQIAEQPLKGALLAAALILLSIDVIASLWLGGRLLGARQSTASVVAAMLLLNTMPSPSQAQSPDDFATRATAQVALAYVITGDDETDTISAAGLTGLNQTLFRRTSIEPQPPIGVDIETDELAFFPFIYWPVIDTQPTPSRDGYAKLNRYLRSGGMILFDTRDADTARFGSGSPEGRKLRAIALGLDIPSIEPVPDDHVLTRTFYLLQSFPGRYASRDIWVEAAPLSVPTDGLPFATANDGVTPVVIGGNDWARAWAVNDRGDPMFPVGRGQAGERQREFARRFGVNLIMHVLTGNYKSDQVHVPALLDRLGQ